MLATNSKSTEYRNHNAGFSLMELIVVIAIMAVLTGIGLVTYTIVNNANVQKAANAVSNLMSECRVNAKAKATTSWGLCIDYSDKSAPTCTIYQGDSATAYNYEPLTSGTSLTIYYPVTDENGVIVKNAIHIAPTADGGDAQYVGVTYVKLSGKVSSVSVGTTSISETTLPECDYYDFVFNKGSKTYSVRLYRTTGKNELLAGTFTD